MNFKVSSFLKYKVMDQTTEEIFQYVEEKEFKDVKLAAEKNPSSDTEPKILMRKMSKMERFHNR